MRMAEIVRYVSVGVVLLAGSCASPTLGSFADPNANYPLSAEPLPAEAEFTAPAPSAGLAPVEAARFGSFVAGFLESGHGAITVSVPDGQDAPDIIAFFGEKLASLGVPRSRILVGMHSAETSAKVKIAYVGYRVKSTSCANWTKNRGDTGANKPAEDFGCATQHNIAAQVENPGDLTNMRQPGARDAARRDDVVQKYEKGTPTNTQTESAAKVSNVGN